MLGINCFRLRAGSAFASIVLLMTGCGQASNSPMPSSAAAKPDVIVTLDGPRHACSVALPSEAQGSTISCEDLVPFLRNELRLTGGSIYDLRAIPTVDEAQLAKIKAALTDAGYRMR